MNALARYLAAMLLIPAVANAQSPVLTDRQSFVSLSNSLAYDLGKTYQMGKNCDKELSSIGPSATSDLFINYMKEQEIQLRMNYYANGLESKLFSLCEQKELTATGPILITRISNYVKGATPFLRLDTQQ